MRGVVINHDVSGIAGSVVPQPDGLTEGLNPSPKFDIHPRGY